MKKINKNRGRPTVIERLLLEGYRFGGITKRGTLFLHNGDAIGGMVVKVPASHIPASAREIGVEKWLKDLHSKIKERDKAASEACSYLESYRRERISLRDKKLLGRAKVIAKAIYPEITGPEIIDKMVSKHGEFTGIRYLAARGWSV